MRKSISRLLELEGFNVRAFGDPQDFLNEMATNHVRLVVLEKRVRPACAQAHVRK
jgi:FixJ family two-component response regulator